MPDPIEIVAPPAFVEAELNYIVDDGVPPVRYVDWPEEAHKAHPATYEARRVRIHDGRAAPEPFALATHGFAFTAHETEVRDFFDEEEVLRVYYPEIERLIQAWTGAARVLVFDHTLRTADDARHAERWIRPTVHAVHNDYTERSAPQRLRDFLPADEAEAALRRRFAVVQVWRGIRERIESEPLAMCDGRTIPEVGFIPYQRRYRDRTGETYHIAWSPAHRWWFFPGMARNEAILFKVFDSDAGGETRFTAHSAFDDPSAPPDARPRESIEMRALALY